ncbi:MAG: urease accessory protein UreF [Microcoleaceae cyanobacterium]
MQKPKNTLLQLLQLASPTLPVGAYSYSEGIETLVEQEIISNSQTLQHWLEHELQWGSSRIDGVMVVRAYHAIQQQNYSQFKYWNQWWSAARETTELRHQSWQMGRSLSRLLLQLDPTTAVWLEDASSLAQSPWNWAIAFGGAAGHWQIDLEATLLAYYQSWASNLIGAGVKLIPLGQTVGQQILFNLASQIKATVAEVMELKDTNLNSCSWGLALASSQHASQRVRLFQS